MMNFLFTAIAEQIQRNFLAQTMTEEELKVCILSLSLSLSLYLTISIFYYSEH